MTKVALKSQKAFDNFVKSGDLFELIDGDTLRIHNQEIQELILDKDLRENKRYSVISILGA